MTFQRVPQIESWFEPVMILAPHALPFEVAPSFEIDHDPLNGPFRNLHLDRNVSNADGGRERDAIQDMRMVTQERPVIKCSWFVSSVTSSELRGNRSAGRCPQKRI